MLANNKITFTGQPLYKLSIPTLVDDSYKLKPVIFSKLNPQDSFDIQMIKENQHNFAYRNILSIPETFLDMNKDHLKMYDFYALELPDVEHSNNKLLGLLQHTKIDQDDYKYIPESIYIDTICVRSDLRKRKLFRFKKREYKNVGEFLMCGISLVAKSQNKGIHLISGANSFYNAIQMKGRPFRKFNNNEIDTFLSREEKKFDLKFF